MKKKCIVGRRHLACRRELAEGEKSFRALCESNIRWRFASIFHIVLSVEKPFKAMVPWLASFSSIANITFTTEFITKE